MSTFHIASVASRRSNLRRPRRESLHHHLGRPNYDPGDGLCNGRRCDNRSRAGVLGSAVNAGCHRAPGRASRHDFRRPRIRHGEHHGFADYEHRRHGRHLSGRCSSRGHRGDRLRISWKHQDSDRERRASVRRLALGLSSISGGQITSIASSAATAAAAIQTAI